jgi:hypothetical protein
MKTMRMKTIGKRTKTKKTKCFVCGNRKDNRAFLRITSGLSIGLIGNICKACRNISVITMSIDKPKAISHPQAYSRVMV